MFTITDSAANKLEELIASEEGSKNFVRIFVQSIG
ncbi:Fe-S cluster assembly iron-binding protein IscA [Sporohalobacter salinus]|nr:Fe-S cluster assembly iron-binding protein IscA [Sporohalobacter salinus]